MATSWISNNFFDIILNQTNSRWKKAVADPIKTIADKTVGTYSNKGEHLIIKKTPAVTIVAAWINAETGVGPSIASGSHVCNPIWADFPIAPINNKEQITLKAESS